MNIEEILKRPNGSIEALSVNLDAVPFGDKYGILEQLLNKIVRGGSITIIGLDIYSFSKSVIASSRSVAEANEIIAHSQSLDTLDNVKRFLLQNNFKTESCKRENGLYICTARHQV